MNNTLIKKHLLNCSVMASLCYSGSVLAMEHYEEDLQKSKTSSLISGIPVDLNEKKNGVMTLCFNDETNDPALVFEMFYPDAPDEITMRMIEHKKEILCMGYGKYELRIHPPVTSLIKAHRAKDVKTTGTIDNVSPEYSRYAAWLISNENLIEGLRQVEDDINNSKTLSSYIFSSFNSTTYAKKIMEAVGLKNIDFGWGLKTPDNLKELVDRSIEPPANVTRDTLPRHM